MAAIQVTPRLEIDLAKIRHNSHCLSMHLGQLGVGITGVTKVALGDPLIANAMLGGGINRIGDSRIENIRKLHDAGVAAELVLLRSPQLSRVDDVVKYADISLNSEPEVIRRLSQAAERQGRTHRVLLMVELGDLREGIPLSDLDEVMAECLALPNLEVEGIGTNLTCLSGVKPDAENMGRLSRAAESLRAKFGIGLATVSGGNSSSLNWLLSTTDVGAINNLRLGEAILLGCETLYSQPIPGLFQNAITLVAEVIESKVKPSVPEGDIAQNAFGEVPSFVQRGNIRRSILGMGLQDIMVTGITPENQELTVIGASSDHLVLDSTVCPLKVGEEVRFHLSYGALLAAMTSPYVEKIFRDESSRVSPPLITGIPA